jgi:hypothetical protein
VHDVSVAPSGPRPIHLPSVPRQASAVVSGTPQDTAAAERSIVRLTMLGIKVVAGITIVVLFGMSMIGFGMSFWALLTSGGQ